MSPRIDTQAHLLATGQWLAHVALVQLATEREDEERAVARALSAVCAAKAYCFAPQVSP